MSEMLEMKLYWGYPTQTLHIESKAGDKASAENRTNR